MAVFALFAERSVMKPTPGMAAGALFAGQRGMKATPGTAVFALSVAKHVMLTTPGQYLRNIWKRNVNIQSVSFHRKMYLQTAGIAFAAHINSMKERDAVSAEKK